MKKLFICAALLFSIIILLPYSGLLEHVLWRMDAPPLGPDGKNLAQELGFNKDAKLLIVNSDDTGAHPTFTHGIVQVMPFGLVKSTSVIVHNRNDAELKRIAKIAKQHPEWGFGVHLMLTNEYQHGFPWSPVLPIKTVPSLYNDKGLAWEKITDVETSANPLDVKKEFIAQIQKAMDAGINVDHIDSHMGTYYRQSTFPNAKSDDLIVAAIETAKHFNLPMTLNTFDKISNHNIEYAAQLGLIRPDTLFGFYELEEINSHLDYQGSFIKKFIVAWVAKNAFGLELPYENKTLHTDDIQTRMDINQQVLLSIAKPGLNHVYMHAARESDSDGMKIPAGKNHAAGLDKVVRLGDSAVWSSQEMKDFLVENKFHLINYSDVKKVQHKWQAMRPSIN